MSYVSPAAASRPLITAVSFSRFAELVRKTGTSATPSAIKRTRSARKKLLRVIKEQHRIAKASNLRAVALTLTYRDSAMFSSKHISRFLDCLRQMLKRAGHRLPYAWVLERAQQLHYHLILWLPRGLTLPPARLEKWWPWGSTWIEGCRSVKAWSRYMAKFECSPATLPKSARLYGYGGLDDAGRLSVTRAALPRWLLALLPANAAARRTPGGGWVDTLTGEIYRSPYIWTPWGVVLRSPSPPACHRVA